MERHAENGNGKAMFMLNSQDGNKNASLPDICQDVRNAIYREELKQAYTRAIYIAVLLPILASICFFAGDWHVKMFTVIAGYIVAALAHFLFVRIYPCCCTIARKLVIIALDMMVTTVIVFYLQDMGFPFSLLYLWVIVGNGMRFGVSFTFVAMAMALVCLLVLFVASPYWQAHIPEMIYLSSASILLPLFMLKLIGRLHDRNKKLQNLLGIIHYQSQHDSLTGLANREYFNQKLLEYIEQSNPFSMFFIDLDGFKRVNDFYGHAAGDAVLRAVADRLREVARNNAFVARLGGDEFVFIFTGSRLEARKSANELLCRIMEPYGHEKQVDFITASIGISHFPSDTLNPSLLKKYADQAMYEVKRRGKKGVLEYREIASSASSSSNGQMRPFFLP